MASNDTLNVRSGPGVSYPIVAGLASNAHDVMRTGRATTVGSAIWWEVQKPGGGTGWSHSSYLTEYVAPSAFCANTSVNALLTSLGTAIKNADGAAFAALVNEKHGVDVRLVSRNKPVNFNKTAAAGIFTSTASYSWGAAEGSGLETTGAFKDVMQPKLLEVFNAATTPACNDTSKTGTVSQPWPPEYSPFNFYSIHKPAASGSLDWRTFLVGVEFVEGKPYVVSLVHFQWAP
ncbi:MAG: SH3 domain-containing protein [Chloroflexi bacterium]|nr:MAG: SH3 domain-containing protein [Chloroflexota bacterium]